MGLFSSKQKSEQQTRPWEPTLPGLYAGINAITQFGAEPMEYFPGQTYVGRTPAEQHYLDALKSGAQFAPIISQRYITPAEQAWNRQLLAPNEVLGMGLQDVANNPYLSGAADAITSRVNRNLAENVLPSLARGAGTGGYGGGRHGVAAGIAGRGTSDVLAEQLADMYLGAWGAGLGAETTRYGQALSAAQGALGLTPTMITAGMSPWTLATAMRAPQAAMQREQHERELAEAMGRHEFGEREPLERGTAVMGALLPGAHAFGRTKGKTTSSPSTFSNIGSVLGTGASLLGAGFGGSLGGLAGLGSLFAAPQAATASPLAAGQYNNPWTYPGYRGY